MITVTFIFIGAAYLSAAAYVFRLLAEVVWMQDTKHMIFLLVMTPLCGLLWPVLALYHWVKEIRNQLRIMRAHQ